MKKAVLVYNPKAGNRQIVRYLDYIIKRIQDMGYELRCYRSPAKGSIETYVKTHVNKQNTDIILVSGGDGTINECINGLADKLLDIPMGILPLGTANDFASSIGISQDIKEALDCIQQGNPQYVDIGKVNNRYFVNVCNMGLFSSVSHVIDLELKKNFGKLAYYVKGFEELQNYKLMDLTITTESKSLQNKYLLVLIFNGTSAGGFKNLAKYASVNDGLFDTVAIKDIPLAEIPRLFLKILQGEHFDDPNVDYIKSKQLIINCSNDSEKDFVTDIDGEEGPDFPLIVDNISNRFRIFIPKKENA